jgi:glycosyltransferase involved in cell wall biosynthesis
MRIVIVGHAASPDRGSEPGNSWDWAWYLSQQHDVWLVHYPEFRSEVDRYLSSHPNDRLRIEWVHTSSWFDPWHPDRSSTGIRFKIHYMLWLARTQRVVADLVRREAIDIVHHVGLNTVSAPSRLWRLPVPFIWGPIGGGQSAPPAFRNYYGKDWAREQRRRLRIRLIGRSSALRRAVSHTRYMMTMNRETEALLVSAGADPKRVALMMDSGVRPDGLRVSPRTAPIGNVLTLLWASRHETRKALPVLLDALAGLGGGSACQASPPLQVRVLIAGDGPKRAEWQRYAETRGVAHLVEFLGMVAPTQMAELYEKSDVFVFTSLQDAFGSVVTEALTHALPIILLNHHGCAAVVPEGAAIKIPVTTPAETVAALTAAIEDLRQRPQQLQALSERALAAARQFQWPARAAAMTRVYEKVAQAVAREC